jgi:hypothetical protein
MSDNDKGTSFVLELRALHKKMPPPAVGVEYPQWLDIENAIDGVFQNGGFVHLRVLDPDISFTNLLDMTALPGRFRLVILTKFDDPKNELREWWEAGDEPYRGTQQLSDHDWDARTVCTDVSVAKQIFKDLFDHGELTESSFVQMRSNWNPKSR